MVSVSACVRHVILVTTFTVGVGSTKCDFANLDLVNLRQRHATATA